MNELSKEVFALETHEKAKSYYNVSEQYAYKFLMEVKKIRDEKLFLELGCSEFEEYTESYFGYSKRTINERIQIAQSWGSDYERALASYGKHKARQLGLLPEIERENLIENGVPTETGVKPIDEATTREIETYKRQLKVKDEQIEMQARMIEDLNEQEPQVIEKEVVVERVPSDYNKLKQLTTEISSENQSLKQEKERLEREVTQKNEALQTKRTIENDELEQAKLARLQRNADINVHKLIINMNDFVKEQSVTVYDSTAIAGATTETKEKLSNSIKRVEKLLSEIKQEIGGEVTWIIN
ncbi:MAG TPA: hypothetical protein IAA20_07535 [Candidatus Enterococcus avicola]|uniref:DUF3102 domain-containing protein n=1 Tax=Candidatus Enterococcus avicola TaxID=2838561 RepID=A0A9D2JJG7_9ENTE|nr:hypothetical protein [Candidatus Enterococcus avicola]